VPSLPGFTILEGSVTKIVRIGTQERQVVESMSVLRALVEASSIPLA